jgi:protein arginine kinase
MKGGGKWNDVVLTSRLRLARNLRQRVFPSRADTAELRSARTEAFAAIRQSNALKNFERVNLEDLTAVEQESLVERYVTSREHIEREVGRGLAFDPSGSFSVLINEEDHFRIQALLPGLQLSPALRWVNQVDDALSALCEFAFSERYGYLTACPTNVGTGLRASVMLHLPGLALLKRLDKVMKQVEESDLAVRGLYGEGSDPWGNLYQLSNQTTLGLSEEEIIQTVSRVAEEVTQQELSAREELLSGHRTLLEDKVWRAYGVLTQARLISCREATDLLSSLRLGVDTGLLSGMTKLQLNELLVWIRPASLQVLRGHDLSAEERDAARARMIREQLLNRS